MTAKPVPPKPHKKKSKAPYSKHFLTDQGPVINGDRLRYSTSSGGFELPEASDALPELLPEDPPQ